MIPPPPPCPCPPIQSTPATRWARLGYHDSLVIFCCSNDDLGCDERNSDEDVTDGKVKAPLKKDDSLEKDEDVGKFSYNEGSLNYHRRRLSKKENPKRKMSNVSEVDEKSWPSGGSK